MRELTESIERLLNGGARSINNRVDGFAGVLHNAGKNAENVDGTGANVIRRYSFPAHTRGSEHRIHTIRVNPLVDPDGNTFGISFPTMKEDKSSGIISDEEFYSKWSRMPNRLSDREYVSERLVDPGDGREPYWEQRGPSQPAPWADEARDGMLYVHAHTNESGFIVDANFGDDANPDWKIRSLSAESFGHVVAANKYFQVASRMGPGKPLMMLACKAGDPAYAHAEQAAEVIHRAGMNHDVYATTGTNGVRWDEEKGIAEVGVEVPDNTAPSDAITVIRAPNW